MMQTPEMTLQASLHLGPIVGGSPLRPTPWVLRRDLAKSLPYTLLPFPALHLERPLVVCSPH